MFSPIIDLLEGRSHRVTEGLRKRTEGVSFASECDARLEKGPSIIAAGNVKEISGKSTQTLVMRLRLLSFTSMHSHKIRLAFPSSGFITMPHSSSSAAEKGHYPSKLFSFFLFSLSCSVVVKGISPWN